jgi:hypothetical protein
MQYAYYFLIRIDVVIYFAFFLFLWRWRLLYDGRSSQSVCLGIEHPYGTCDQILLPVGMLLSEICGLVSVGRPIWREDGSTICSVITQWSESRRTRNHTLLSHLRLPQPGGPDSRIYIHPGHMTSKDICLLWHVVVMTSVQFKIPIQSHYDVKLKYIFYVVTGIWFSKCE